MSKFFSQIMVGFGWGCVVFIGSMVGNYISFFAMVLLTLLALLALVVIGEATIRPRLADSLLFLSMYLLVPMWISGASVRLFPDAYNGLATIGETVKNLLLR